MPTPTPTATFNVITTSGTTRSGATYNYLNPSPFGSPNANGLVIVTDFGVDLTDTPGMSLIYASALTNSGGNISLTGFVEASCVDFDCNAPANPQRDIIGGSVNAVPVPAAVWLFASALAGLGWLRRSGQV